ncbi:VOC family protein [Halobacillus sp. ACCC02827]|uniref:VOC family protein n=1 Tax=unclassified Halobacillus TaxID=2636472 RepID=UPI000783BAF8|nr:MULTISPECIES: VOC family protein [unclassified Halobacillus]WJE15051.1 VOC family protein [Halobacillus sp. ACCC02827]
MSIKLTPYLVFDGNAREALAFYEEALQGRITGIMKFKDMPENPDHPLPDEMKDRIMHAQLKAGEADIMFSDSYPGMSLKQGENVQLAILPDDEETAQHIFDALAAEGETIMPLQKTDWSPVYGQVKDKFGITFQINVDEEPSS